MIKVFFNPLQQVDSNLSFSKSASKPKKVVEEFKNNFPVEIISNFKPLSVEELSSAHSRSFVEDVLSLKINNGFGNTAANVANSLPWTCGSFYAAAQDAFINKSIACSPTSGFHHAKFDKARYFCTFNGLVVAAQLLKEKFNIKSVGIIDFDMHEDDGTEAICEHLNLDYIKRYSLGRLDLMEEDVDPWLMKMTEYLEKEFSKVDIVFYQAGADPWVRDPLGGLMTKSQLVKRDLLVFAFALKFKIPLVWNLAGGYSEPYQHVLDIHNNTMAALVTLKKLGRPPFLVSDKY